MSVKSTQSVVAEAALAWLAAALSAGTRDELARSRAEGTIRRSPRRFG